MTRTERIAVFVETLWKWYEDNKRMLPWRDLWHLPSDDRAYRVLLSEIMLQQTQVPRVVTVFPHFLAQFPTVLALARASTREVLLAWRGMGYNRRALALRNAAQTLVSATSTGFPNSMGALTSIPGIGHYTAAAIRNFAFNLPTPCLDTNIRRILHRTFVGPENPDGTWRTGDTSLLRIAEETLHAALANSSIRRRTSDWHCALMDFGSLVQTKRNPRWTICPLTACGIMVTTPARWYRRLMPHTPCSTPRRSEPGRIIAGRFVPNRIIRGRIVEELCMAPRGLRIDALGKRIAPDWSLRQRPWLKSILADLERDVLIRAERDIFLI